MGELAPVHFKPKQRAALLESLGLADDDRGAEAIHELEKIAGTWASIRVDPDWEIDAAPSKQRKRLRRLHEAARAFEAEIAKVSGSVLDSMVVAKLYSSARDSHVPVNVRPELEDVAGRARTVGDLAFVALTHLRAKNEKGDSTDSFEEYLLEAAAKARTVGDLASVALTHLRSKREQRGRRTDPFEEYLLEAAANVFERYSGQPLTQGKSGFLSRWEAFIVLLFRVLGLRKKGEKQARSFVASRREFFPS